MKALPDHLPSMGLLAPHQLSVHAQFLMAYSWFEFQVLDACLLVERARKARGEEPTTRRNQGLDGLADVLKREAEITLRAGDATWCRIKAWETVRDKLIHCSGFIEEKRAEVLAPLEHDVDYRLFNLQHINGEGLGGAAGLFFYLLPRAVDRAIDDIEETLNRLSAQIVLKLG